MWLIGTGPRTGRIKVALSDGTGYGPDQLWYEGDTLVPTGGAALLVGRLQRRRSSGCGHPWQGRDRRDARSWPS